MSKLSRRRAIALGAGGTATSGGLAKQKIIYRKMWKLKAIQYNALYEGDNRALVEQATAKVASQTNTGN